MLTRLTRAGRSVLTLNRDREYAALLEMLSLTPEDSLLDVGSGDGFWTARFARRCGRAVGLEVDSRAISWARDLSSRPNVEYVCGMAEALPFPDGSFDKVVSISSLEHLADPEQGIREMVRVLRPDGRLALSADSLLAENSGEQFREWHRWRHCVIRYFHQADLERIMRESGLRLEPTRTVHLFRSRLAASLRKRFIRNPRSWLPLFPMFYGSVRLADRWADETHGQIVIVTGMRERPKKMQL